MTFCYTCVHAVKSGPIKNLKNSDLAFISRGYRNWRNSSCEKGDFATHEKCSVHKTAVEVIVTLSVTTRDVNEILSTAPTSEKVVNWDYIFKLFDICQFPLWQGIPLRGDGDEKDNNFMQLLCLCCCDNPVILEQLRKKTDKYTNPIIQNEILEIVVLKMLQKTELFTLMVDKDTDVSNREQVVICFWWVDDQYQTHEDFVGLLKVETITSDTITSVLKDVVFLILVFLQKLHPSWKLT